MANNTTGMSIEEAHRTIKRVESRHEDYPEGTQSEGAPVEGVAYRYFKQRSNAAFKPWYWRRLRALYAGGEKLLGDSELLREIFPPHRDEHPEVYKERVKRAFYTPYAGEIVDHIVSALCAETVSMTTEESSAPDEWWDDFSDDVSPTGGEKISLHAFLKSCMLTAQQCRTAWALVDLPSLIDDDGEPFRFADRKEQEEAGALDAYIIELEPESVIDWEQDDAGKLEWVLIHVVENKRESLIDDRDWVVERWTYYTRDAWAQYALRHKANEEPRESTLVPLIAKGTHTFGEVPVARLELPEGLWTMAKLEGLAREHLNKRSGLAWAELQSLLPELYEFKGPEENFGTPVAGVQQDPGRVVNQVRGQGYVQERGHQDRAEFVGPDTGPFTQTRESCDSLRDEMHRVTHQMALSTDNGPAALGRSADSKAQDKAATAVVLTELGKLTRLFAEELYRLVSIARKEPFADEWTAQGMEKFDDVAVDTEVDQALIIDQLGLESPTFRRRHRFHLCKLILGDVATDDDLEQIESELELNIPDEWFPRQSEAPLAEVDLATLLEGGEPGEGEPGDPGDGEGEEDDEEGGKPPPGGKGAPGKRTAFSSGGRA